MRRGDVLICLLALFIASNVCATMYKYTDEYGNDFYADRLEAVPEKYISHAEIIDDHLEKAGLTIQPERAEKGMRIKVLEDTSILLDDTRHRFLKMLESVDRSLLNNEIVKYSVVIITFIAIVALLISVREFIGPRKAGMMIATVIGIFAFMFIYNIYMKNVVDKYLELSGKVLEMRSAAKSRYKLINEMSALNGSTPQKPEKFVPPWEQGETNER